MCDRKKTLAPSSDKICPIFNIKEGSDKILILDKNKLIPKET